MTATEPVSIERIRQTRPQRAVQVAGSGDSPRTCQHEHGPAHAGTAVAVTGVRCGAALVIARESRTCAVNLRDLVTNLSDSPAKPAGVIVNEF